MARIRSIHPSHLEDPDILALSDAAYRLWVGLIQLADDEGRGVADPRVLSVRVFGAQKSPEEVKGLVRELNERLGSLVFYRVGDRWYYAFTKWKRWQSPQKPKPSEYPSPEEADFVAPKPKKVAIALFDEEENATGMVREASDTDTIPLQDAYDTGNGKVSVGKGIGKGKGMGMGDIYPPPPSNVPPPPEGEGEPQDTQPDTPKRKKKTEKKTDPRVKRLVDEFTRRLRERVPGVAVPGGRMAKAIQGMLRALDKAPEVGPERAEEVLSRCFGEFFRDESQWVREQGWSWSAFQARYPGYLVKVLKPRETGKPGDYKVSPELAKMLGIDHAG